MIAETQRTRSGAFKKLNIQRSTSNGRLDLPSPPSIGVPEMEGPPITWILRRKKMSGRRDSNPHVPCGTTDFRATSAFAASCRYVPARVRGLDSAFIREGCSPSSLYTSAGGRVFGLALRRFARRCLAARMAIRAAGGSPSLRSSTSGVAAGALKSDQVRSVCRSATPG